MPSYDKELKALSQHLRKNMTDAENMLWLKLRRIFAKEGKRKGRKDLLDYVRSQNKFTD